MSRRVPRKDSTGGPRPEKGEDDGGFDEVAFGGSDPVDPASLLGPVDEFTLSIPMEGTTNPGFPAEPAPPPPPRPAPRTPARAAPPPPPSRSATPAPAPSSRTPAPAPSSRTPAPAPSSRTPAASRRRPEPDPLTTGVLPALDPLVTGVVDALADHRPDPTVLPSLSAPGPTPKLPPGGPSIGDATAALMLDGLELDEVPLNLAEPSVGLPEVVMPPPDTGRARPLRPDGRPMVVSLEPQDAPAPTELEAAAARPSPTPRPSPERGDPWRPAARARPEQRPADAPPRQETSAISFGAPPAPRPAEAPPPRPAPTAPSTTVLRGLDPLLALVDEPPEREETLSAALELLSLDDEPPEREETIGAALIPVTGTVELPPPEDQVSLDDLELPPTSTSPTPPRRDVDEIPFGHQETRPIAPQILAAVHQRPTEVPEPPGAVSARTGRPIEFLPPPPSQKPLQTAQLRRETYRPAGAPPPSAPQGGQGPSGPPRSVPPPAPPPPVAPAAPPPAPTVRAPRPSAPEPPTPAGPSLQAEPVLMWAATLLGMLVLGACALVLLIIVTYIV